MLLKIIFRNKQYLKKGGNNEYVTLGIVHNFTEG